MKHDKEIILPVLERLLYDVKEVENNLIGGLCLIMLDYEYYNVFELEDLEDTQEYIFDKGPKRRPYLWMPRKIKPRRKWLKKHIKILKDEL